MVAGVPCGFHQLVDDDARRRAVRIAHAEIDDIDLCRPRLRAHLVDDGEYVRRQLLNAVKLFWSSGITRYFTTAAGGAGELRFDHETLRR